MPSSNLILHHHLLLLPSILPNIRVFPMCQLFTSGDQSIGASASAPVLPVNIQGWFPLGFPGLISLLSKGFLEFSSTTVVKYQFFGAQPSLWSNSHLSTWPLEKKKKKHSCDYMNLCPLGMSKKGAPLWGGFCLSCSVCVLSHFSHVQLFAILWTVVCQPPPPVHGILQVRILEEPSANKTKVFSFSVTRL